MISFSSADLRSISTNWGTDREEVRKTNKIGTLEVLEANAWCGDGTVHILRILLSHQNITIIIMLPTLLVLNVGTLRSLCLMTFPNPSILPGAQITQTSTALLLSHIVLSAYLKQRANCSGMCCSVHECAEQHVSDIIEPELWDVWGQKRVAQDFPPWYKRHFYQRSLFQDGSFLLFISQTFIAHACELTRCSINKKQSSSTKTRKHFTN